MAYPTEAPAPGVGGRVASVVEGGPADAAGIAPGMRIVTANGQPLRDVIDWFWAADGEQVELSVSEQGGRSFDTVMEREWGDPWGLEFEGVVFDGIRECDNACSFCFVAQLPAGMRPSLYVRDDDYRLSFLVGNFVTLTNLEDADVERIVAQRLSPLHVSLHAVDDDVRRRLMCPTVEDRALEHIDTLLDAGIDIHVQIVLVPGINDGEALDRSVRWCAARDGVLSVGVVPVGFTAHGKQPESSYGSPEAAARLLDHVDALRSESFGRGPWLFAADEFYLRAGRPLPAWEEYGDFPQYENGVGMARAFIDEAAEALEDLEPLSGGPAVTLVSGELFAPVLEGMTGDLSRTGCDVRVLAVPNRLLGGNVDVTGLLGGGDVARAIAADAGHEGIYLLSDAAVNDDDLMIDDLTVEDVADRAGADVRLVSCDAAGLVSALSALAVSNSG